MTTHYDVVIIGSGAGGGTLARALAPTGRRILVVERGGDIVREAGNWNPAVVWVEQRYRAKERWLTPGGEFQPNIHYGVGGNTKFWGAVLYRLREEDFEATRHADGESPAWPIAYADLAPYYERAERLYYVHGEAGADPTDPPRGAFPHPPVPHTEGMRRAFERLHAGGWHPSPLPLGLIRPGEDGGCRLCGTCNSFPCMIGAKSDAETCGIAPARTRSNLHVATRTLATRLIADPTGRRVVAVEVDADGTRRRIHGDLFVAACGAVNSAALLLRSGDPARGGLANSSGLVGRHYMAHVTTMYSAFGWKDGNAGPHGFHKTIAINDYYRAADGCPHPLGHIQSQGALHPEMILGGAPERYRRGIAIVRSVAPWSFRYWTDRSMQWLAMTEDLPLRENRVTLRGDRICLSYRPSNMGAHRALNARVKAVLRACGAKTAFPVSFGLGNTTHQCGTLRFGHDPGASVLDPWCRAHDVDNLFVVDASFFPSSAAVNPGLTIAAQALRVADYIGAHHLGAEIEP
ncbi:MAG: GMC family oxidoreductase [Acidobacteria bacterium]|nr:GMC family oxidoreductase [Acidobacteriota bacterium]